MRTIYEFILLFFIFSVGGWIMEVTLKFFQYHRFINRGVLLGPYCPIYGWGITILTILLGGILNVSGSYAETFIAGTIVCGVLEYLTSLYLEKVFHARWWDYSNKPMNLHGRIWIGNLLLFGIASTVIVKIIDPIYFHYVAKIPNFLMMIIAITIVVIMAADSILSHFVLNDVKKTIENVDLDNTEEISKKVRELLKDKNFLQRRIKDAYPNFQARPKRIVNELKEAKNDVKLYHKEVKRLMKIHNDQMLEKANKKHEQALQRLEEIKQKYHI